jgi:hypothetical protein
MTKRISLGIACLLVVAALAGAACSTSRNTAGSAAPAASAVEAPAFGGGAAKARPRVSEANVAPPGVPAVAPRVIKTASLGIRVKRGAFDQRFQDAAEVAARFGGYVSSSETAGAKRHSGMLVIRVPVDRFEAALGALKGLGVVTEQRLSGQDVTAQFVDLQARLRNWEAQEQVLLGLMAKATAIEDSIRVQQHLQDVQLTIEELKGQLQVLSDQSDFSTISLSMTEAGFVAPVRTEEGLTLPKAWHNAVEGFIGVIGAVVVGLGYAIPLGLIALLGLAIFRWTRPKVAPPDTSSA